jgi:hypothetical protein
MGTQKILARIILWVNQRTEQLTSVANSFKSVISFMNDESPSKVCGELPNVSNAFYQLSSHDFNYAQSNGNSKTLILQLCELVYSCGYRPTKKGRKKNRLFLYKGYFLKEFYSQHFRF